MTPTPAGMTASGLAGDLCDTLRGFTPPDPGQASLRRAFLAYLHAHPDAVFRDGPPQHFTASLLVVDAVGAGLSRVLLTHHRRARMWLQFGGHLEPGDATVLDAARREGREESGLDALQVRPQLVELDRHELHGDFVRCTQHLDLRWVAVAPRDAVHRTSDESLDVSWWPAQQLPEPSAPDLARLVERVRRLR